MEPAFGGVIHPALLASPYLQGRDENRTKGWVEAASKATSNKGTTREPHVLTQLNPLTPRRKANQVNDSFARSRLEYSLRKGHRHGARKLSTPHRKSVDERRQRIGPRAPAEASRIGPERPVLVPSLKKTVLLQQRSLDGIDEPPSSERSMDASLRRLDVLSLGTPRRPSELRRQKVSTGSSEVRTSLKFPNNQPTLLPAVHSRRSTVVKERCRSFTTTDPRHSVGASAAEPSGSVGPDRNEELAKLRAKSQGPRRFSRIQKESYKVPRIIAGAYTMRGRDPEKAFKVNQDGFITLREVSNDPRNVTSSSLLVVIDGHGRDGHHVTNYLKRNYASILDQYQFSRQPEQALVASFEEANGRLRKGDMDCSLSGATLTVMLCLDRQCFVANVGDSRAVMVLEDGDVTVLSRDHKPMLPTERKRIESHGGLVAKVLFAGQDDVSEPYRVFKVGENSPGLAMSRSLGDNVAASLGVIATPDVNCITLSETAMALVCASDGVWDKVTNEECAAIVHGLIKQGADASVVARKVVEEGRRRWESEGEDEYIDDITAVVGLLNWR